MTSGFSGDLVVPPGRGLPSGLTVPAAELVERFSRSSGPGGQGVNTTDSRVELRYDVAQSSALTEAQRSRALAFLAPRLVDGVLSITASEQRSQLQNRLAARGRLANYLSEALAPPPPPRRATRPSRGAKQRRLDVKKQRSQIKAGRARVQGRDD
jgi:ribosome-associated protein